MEITMASVTTSTKATGVARTSSEGSVAFAETRSRAGNLLEQGAAFARLERLTLDATAGDASPMRGLTADVDERRCNVVVIGGGQAGLSVAYHLARHGVDFVILEASNRIGDGWRHRWDSLRLFTPARYDGLDGMPFPAPAHTFPTKDAMADYLEAYATRFQMPVLTGARVDEVTRADGRYVVCAGKTRFLADHVVVAAASYQKASIPQIAAALDPSIAQFHSSTYKNPAQLKPGTALLVGAGNSGAELALDLARTHQVWLAGRHPGHLPFAYNSAFALHVVVPLLFRIVFHRMLSVDTAMGRKARPQFLGHSGPLIRVKPRDLVAAGVRRVPRVAGVRDGKPLLEDGQCVDADNVVWCTGFQPGMEWIKLPVFDASGRPNQYRGVAAGEPGLYFAGLAFQHSPSSTMVHGIARDARRVVDTIVQRMRATVS
jgi:putative flavoprotein involved in K+ transport